MAGKPRISNRALTNAEHQARWRARHAKKVARRTPHDGAPTMEALLAGIPTLDDLASMCVVPRKEGK
jgi:hypothetical protein